MRRVSIGRVVIDAECLGTRDAESFRVALEKAVAAALNGQGWETPVRSHMEASIDGGVIDAAGDELTTAVASRVAASLGGDR